MPAAHRLKINWNDLEEAFQLGSDEVKYFLDRNTGKVILSVEDSDLELDMQDADDDDLDPAPKTATVPAAQIIEIPRSSSRDGYEDMQAYIETVRDPHLRETLEIAIQGKGAFRRFKDVLARSQNLAQRERWFQFQQERIQQRIRDWLEDEGIEVIEQNGDTSDTN